MTTGEKIALLRKKKGLTQEELSDILKVSRQSVSRWEMDVTFPETDKLIQLSKLFECSIDYITQNGQVIVRIGDRYIHSWRYILKNDYPDYRPERAAAALLLSVHARIAHICRFLPYSATA